MSTQTSKEEYLKKYLSGGKDKKKKRLKEHKSKGTRIIDDDAPLPKAVAGDARAELLLAPPEERPQVAEWSESGVPAAAAAGVGGVGRGGDARRWKALDECDLEELESRRQRLSATLRQLEQDTDPGAEPQSRLVAGRGQRRRRHDSSDDAQSPPPAAPPPQQQQQRRRRRDSSDCSPPRRVRPTSAVAATGGGGDSAADSDCSPPRRAATAVATVASLEAERANSDESPPRSWKSTKPPRTLDGRRAGLQDLATLRAENRAAKQRDKHQIELMNDSVSGRNAETKLRGRKLEKARERAEEEKKARQRKEVYDVWNKGVKQVEQQRQRVDEHVYEMAKPFSRHADDADLEQRLRSRQRADDPMAAYMAQQQHKHGAAKKSRPRYNKSEPPANRYDIWPGYRWDGVDRSNGFELRLFQRQSAKVARDAEAYKWSTEDM